MWDLVKALHFAGKGGVIEGPLHKKEGTNSTHDAEDIRSEEKAGWFATFSLFGM